MAKVTTEEYGKVAAMVLSLPRKNRDMLERALVAKREKEDADKAEKAVSHE